MQDVLHNGTNLQVHYILLEHYCNTAGRHIYGTLHALLVLLQGHDIPAYVMLQVHGIPIAYYRFHGLPMAYNGCKAYLYGTLQVHGIPMVY